MNEPTELSVHEVREILGKDASVRLLDVREDYELAIASIPQAEPLTGDLANEMLETGDRNAFYIFSCHHGVRSMTAARFFAQHGFTRVASMSGGIHAWALEIDPSIPTY